VGNDNDFVPGVAGPNRWYVFGFTDEYLAGLNLSYSPQEIAGVRGAANSHGKTVSALAQQYGGVNNAAEALGYASVADLQNATRQFCGN